MAESKKNERKRQDKDTRKPYEKPQVESAKIYERLALGCGLADARCRPPLKSA